MCISKTPCQSSTHVNLKCGTIVDIIVAIPPQFYFGAHNKYHANIYPTVNDDSTDINCNDAMIVINFYKRNRVHPADINKLLSSSCLYYTQQLNNFTMNGKMYHQVIILLMYVSNHNITHYQSLVDSDANGKFSGEYVTVINTPSIRHVKL